MKSICLFLAVAVSAVACTTEPNIWPMPQKVSDSGRRLAVDPKSFKVTTKTLDDCPLLDAAVERYKKLFFISDCSRIAGQKYFDNNDNESKPEIDFPEFNGTLTALVVEVTGHCESAPHVDMNENYTITVFAHPSKTAYVTAPSIWGALRGLETFSQILEYDAASGAFSVLDYAIVDFPRFGHRGFMLDSSRHFLRVERILQTLDAVAFNKMNVFHWHVVDDESFPYVSRRFPELQRQGTHDPERERYDKDDIEKVLEHARQRGIRVIVEFDTPGHSASWRGQPGLLTECPATKDVFARPIDPSNEANWEFLTELFEEIVQDFPDYYIHLGGDEVKYEGGWKCWGDNANVTNMMKQLNITGDFDKLQSYYTQKLGDIISSKFNRSYITWEEVFFGGAQMAEDAIVHVWRGNQRESLSQVTAAGYRALLSSCWYLDIISHGADWEKYYKCDPTDFSGTDKQKELVIGGHAALWGEWVDGTNVLQRGWPRASAAAERLWSAESLKDVAKAEKRIVGQRCRMLRRGLPVQPIVTKDYCECEYAL